MAYMIRSRLQSIHYKEYPEDARIPDLVLGMFLDYGYWAIRALG